MPKCSSSREKGEEEEGENRNQQELLVSGTRSNAVVTPVMAHGV